MEYVLIGLPALLVIWMISLWLRKPGQPQRPPPSSLVEDLAERRLSSRDGLEESTPHYIRWADEHIKAAKTRTTVVGVKRPARSDRQAEARDREDLNATCLGLLSAAAIEHPSGHTKLIARYVLRSKDDDRIEVMFEKAGSGRARLWLTRNCAAELMNNAITFREYPAANLYQPQEGDSTPSYGRYPALKSMRDLANADLIRFTIDRVDQVRTIILKLAPSFTTPAPEAPAGSRTT